VEGHAGKLGMGLLGGTPVYLLSGRSHFYEGHSLEQVTFPVRVLVAAGISDLLLTNAAGGINRRFQAGDFMVFTDHINFMGVNPLRRSEAGAASGRRGESRFADLSSAYDPALRELLGKAALSVPMELGSGVYLAVSGPSYETPAEIRAFARLGADAVGMSTVPETIVARSCGLRVAGLSCITNLAAGMQSKRNRGGERLRPKPISHEEVLAMAEEVGLKGAKLIEEFAKLYGKS
jgi:purine-nucleoside phosphorylase